jgi:hypothetical protein
MTTDAKTRIARAIERARERYAAPSDDDIEIDDSPAAERADGGVWVQAWVWVPDDAEDDL